MKELRFITYRDKDEIMELLNNGTPRVERSLNENLLQELILAYTGDISIIYFWVSTDDLPTLNEYYGHTEKVEFRKPNRPYILLNRKRFEYLNKTVLKDFPEYFHEGEYKEIEFKRLVKEGKLDKCLNDLIIEENYNGAYNPEILDDRPSNVYMGIMNELRLSDIISINGKPIERKINKIKFDYEEFKCQKS